MLTTWAGVIIAVVLVLLSGVFSGLTVAWMSMDTDRLEILERGGTPEQKRFATKVYPLRTHQANQVLCALLCANAAVNVGLAVLLADMTSVLISFFVSTAVILLFGELIPQLYVSRHTLAVSYNSVWLIRLLLLATGIVTWPISKIVDYFVAPEAMQQMTAGELKEQLVDLRKTKGIERNAAKIMTGALDLSGKQVKDVMTPITDIFRIEVTQKLDYNTLVQIFNSGFSRIPCYDAKKKSDPTIGLLFVKDLIMIDPKDEIALNTIMKLYGRAAVHVFPDTPLSKMLELFKSGKCHMAIVHDANTEGEGDPYYEELGVITLEDIIETILQDNIVDETDVYVDVHNKQKVSGRHAIDLSALRGADRSENELTPQELSAIYWHLRGNYDIFKPTHACALTARAIRGMLASAHVQRVRVDRDAKDGKGEALSQTRGTTQMVDIKDGGTWLYQSGKATPYMSVVLDGRVKVRAGRDGFVTEVGKWAVLCWHVFNGMSPQVSALDSKEPSPYKPDFSARVSANSRILRISREQFAAAVRASREEREQADAKEELGDEKASGDSKGAPVLSAQPSDGSTEGLTNGEETKIQSI